MENNTKRTFIPPEKRPSIRGAKLRNGKDSTHYLSIWNNMMRRQLFIRQLAFENQNRESCKDQYETLKKEQTQLNCEEIFGIDEKLFTQLMDDLGVATNGRFSI
jgi:hypothetical protein